MMNDERWTINGRFALNNDPELDSNKQSNKNEAKGDKKMKHFFSSNENGCYHRLRAINRINVGNGFIRRHQKGILVGLISCIAISDYLLSNIKSLLSLGEIAKSSDWSLSLSSVVLASAAPHVDVEDPNEKNYIYGDHDDDNIIGFNTKIQKIYEKVDIDEEEHVDENEKNTGDFVDAEGNDGDAGDDLNLLTVENGLLVLNEENFLQAFGFGHGANSTNAGNPNFSDEDATRRNLYGDNITSKQSKLLLVAFYAPWCEHSFELLKILEEVSSLLQSRMKSILGSSIKMNDSGELPPGIPTPLLGKIDGTELSSEWLVNFNSPDTYPYLAFVLARERISMLPEEDPPIVDVHGHNGSTPSPHSGNNIGISMDKDINVESSSSNNGNSAKGSTTDYDFHLINYHGPRNSTIDILDTVLHYWYRVIISESSSHSAVDTVADIALQRQQEYIPTTVTSSEDNHVKTEDNHHEDHFDFSWMDPMLEMIPSEPVYTFSSFDQMKIFIEKHGEFLFQPVNQTLSAVNSDDGEKELLDILYFMDVDNDNPSSDEDSDALNDPFYAFVQCRQHSGQVKEDKERHEDYEKKSRSFIEFQQLAETYMYRRDIAFFVIVSFESSDGCKWIKDLDNADFFSTTETSETSSQQDEKINKDYLNGAVRALRLFPNKAKSINNNLEKSESEEIELTWVGLDKNQWAESGSAVYVPSLSITSPTGTENVHDYNPHQLNLTQFVVIQSTPSVLWFDKYTSASLAFPIYRHVHVVLFVDMHSLRHGNSKDASLGESPVAKLARKQTKHAVTLMRRASLHHRSTRPTEDVVFLVVPSTEIRIFNTFGIDIWTPLDICVNGNYATDEERVHDVCIGAEATEILPMVLITSRKESSSAMTRYHLKSKELLSNMWNESEKKKNRLGPISSFLSAYFEKKLVHAVKSQSKPPKNRTNESGVQMVTGETFQNLVMDQSERHSLIHFFAPTCGHCKRLSVIWNELGQLIRYLNWDSLVDVMKMDLTQNEVMHDQVNVQNFPAIYYFPAGSKDSPIELVIEGDKELGDSNVGGINNATAVMEWMIKINKFDEEELLRLAETPIN